MLESKLKKIELLLLDVDGVLTDGGIIYNDDAVETKIFSVKDGLGIRLLMDSGVEVGIVTGRKSNTLLHRCNNLGISLILDGVTDKAAHLAQIVKETGITPDKIAFMGDDLPDLPLLNRVGFSISVADASADVRQRVEMVTNASGGHGAVREAAEAILKAKGLWELILKKYE